MNKAALTILSVAVFVAGLLVFYQTRPAKQNTATADQTSVGQKWESKTDNQSEVAITVTPIDLSPQAKEWTFDVAMNTHSVELQDPIKSTVLVDDKGKEYKPIAWNGPTEGHHMNGTLTFKSIVLLPQSVKLKILNAGASEEDFIWTLRM